MSEPLDRAVLVQKHVALQWSDERVDALLDRTRAKRRRRGVLRISAVVVAVAAAAVLAFQLWPVPEPDRIARDPLRLNDGSIARPIDSGSQLVIASVEPRRTIIEVRRGGGHFEVVHRADRIFRVDAGPIHVTVLGTIFDVVLEDDAVHVSVARGRVRVDAPRDLVILDAGERAVFPLAYEEPRLPEPIDVPEEIHEAPPSEEAVPAPRPRRPTPAGPAIAPWRALVDRGEFDAAYEALQSDSHVLDRSDVGELLLAADAARYSNHAAQAIPYYQRVLDDHPGDPRAPLAAFTLGRVLLQQLGRPSDAAEAFARAYDLAPDGSLAEDALAREVESWSRAGREDRARERAALYVQRYPQGLREHAVREYGGLDH
jgi:transmembrane sensor